MIRPCLFALAGLLLAGCGASEVPFATYKGEPNADDAAIEGEIAVGHGRCLYVVTPDGRQHLIALPAIATRWDSSHATLTLSGVILTPGASMVFGGSGLAQPLNSLQWKTRPSNECDASLIWIAGDSAGPPRR